MRMPMKMLGNSIVTELCFLSRVQFACAELENREDHLTLLKTHAFSSTKSSERS